MADVDASLPLAAEFPPVDRRRLADARRRHRPACARPPTTGSRSNRCTPRPTRSRQPVYPASSRSSAGERRAAPARAGTFVSSSTSGGGSGAAVAELERGATSVWLRWSADDPVDPASLAGVLDDVLFDVAPVVLDAGHRWVEAARALRPLWERRGVDPASLAGSLGADPFGDWAVDRDDDRLAADLTALVAEAGPLVAEHPNLRVATIDATRFHDAGASDAEELGVALAVVVATLAHAHGGRTRRRGGVGPTGAASRRDRRPVRVDRQVPRRPARAGPCRRGCRTTRRPAPGTAARRHVTGDDDPLRRRREHRAVDDRLLRRRGRRRRRHHGAPARHVRGGAAQRACADDSPATPRRCSPWSRT